MNEFWNWLSGASGSVLLAILAGAGGSALLELLWRPTRDRRRAARMLTAEVAMNSELLLLQAHTRVHNKYGIPADLRLSLMAWNAVAPWISEFPLPILRQLVQLYNQYDALNRNILMFGEALEKQKAATVGLAAAKDAETMVLRTLDVFNSGLDATLENGRTLLPILAAVARIKMAPDDDSSRPNYAGIAAENSKARSESVEALRRRRERGGGS